MASGSILAQVLVYMGRNFLYDLNIQDPDQDTWNVVLTPNTINAALSIAATSIIISPISPSTITTTVPHILQLTITDTQGAATQYYLEVTVLDNTAPQFVSQPEDITIECY